MGVRHIPDIGSVNNTDLEIPNCARTSCNKITINIDSAFKMMK